ncbi:MAG TPA: PpiC-type peptidyl-prolyl cis-trans isomerase, partial [Agrobacterium sp.]|nr:PpiC-type peptidyl-prolyl cis-trans isomerase [Agrobacterium sp.]
STDTVTGSKGGDLGFRPRQALPAEINTALDGLKPGDFAKTPVETAFGFHVVRLDEMRNTPPPSFETVAPQIRQSLETAEIRRIVTGLRSSAKVEKLVPDVALPAASDDGHNHDGQNAE